LSVKRYRKRLLARLPQRKKAVEPPGYPLGIILGKRVTAGRDYIRLNHGRYLLHARQQGALQQAVLAVEHEHRHGQRAGKVCPVFAAIGQHGTIMRKARPHAAGRRLPARREQHGDFHLQVKVKVPEAPRSRVHEFFQAKPGRSDSASTSRRT
jgi:hypothetical protein